MNVNIYFNKLSLLLLAPCCIKYITPYNYTYQNNIESPFTVDMKITVYHNPDNIISIIEQILDCIIRSWFPITYGRLQFPYIICI